MARVFAWIALRLTIATAVQDGTAVAPNPFDAPTNKRRERKHTHAESSIGVRGKRISGRDLVAMYAAASHCLCRGASARE